MKSDIFRDIVDLEKSSLAPRSRKLFTLSAFYNACADLIQDVATGKLDQDAQTAREFWDAVARHFPAWTQVRDGKLAASEVREGFIHSHGIALQAIGKAGNALLKGNPGGWKSRLKGLAQIDWSRKNARLWEGRALIGGKVSKVTTNGSRTPTTGETNEIIHTAAAATKSNSSAHSGCDPRAGE
jgi:DNA sulfur modification protein DndB